MFLYINSIEIGFLHINSYIWYENIHKWYLKTFKWCVLNPKTATMNTQSTLNERQTRDELEALIKKQEKTIYALQHNDRKYENLFNNSLDGIYRSTLDGKFINVNTALVNMLGYNSKEELLNINIEKQLYFDKNDRKEVVNHFSDADKIRHRLYKKDGAIIWVENHGENIIDNN